MTLAELFEKHSVDIHRANGDYQKFLSEAAFINLVENHFNDLVKSLFDVKKEKLKNSLIEDLKRILD